MKSPHSQRPDPVARELTEAFIAEHTGQRGLTAGKARKAKAAKGGKKKAKAKS